MLATRLGLLGEALGETTGNLTSWGYPILSSPSDVAVDEGEQTEAIRHLTAALRLDTNNQYGNYAWETSQKASKIQRSKDLLRRANC